MTAAELESLYDQHATALTGFLVALTGSVVEARDVLQDVFVRLARSGETADAPREPRAFLLTLARRAAVDRLRREGSRQRRHLAAAVDARLLAPAADPDAEVFRCAIESALRVLPDEQRAAVLLHVWNGLTFREMADVLGIPLHTAASRCRYGLARLREALRPLYAELQ